MYSHSRHRASAGCLLALITSIATTSRACFPIDEVRDFLSPWRRACDSLLPALHLRAPRPRRRAGQVGAAAVDDAREGGGQRQGSTQQSGSDQREEGCGYEHRWWRYRWFIVVGSAKAAADCDAFRTEGKAPARPGRPAPTSRDGGPDSPDDGAQRGVGGTGVVPGPVPRELPARREHGVPGPAPAGGGHGQEGFRPVQRRAPFLLLVQGGGHGLRRRAEVHEGRLPRDDVEEEQVPADHPRARLHLPLHGRGHPLVQGPLPADIPGGAAGHVVGLLRRRSRLGGELPQRRPALRQVLRRHHWLLQALAVVAGAVPRNARAVRVRQDRQGRRAASPGHQGAVPRHQLLRRLLPARQGSGQGLHHARQLLRGAGQQAVRPQECAPGLEDLQGARCSREYRLLHLEGAREVHTLIG